MNKFACFAPRALVAALLIAGAAGPLFAADPPPAAAPAGPTARPEIVTPVNAGLALMRDKKFAEALAEFAKTDAVPMQTPYEQYIINRLRGLASANVAKEADARKYLEAALATGQAPASESLRIYEILAQIASKTKDYKATTTYAAKALADGSTFPDMRFIYAQAAFMIDDFPTAIRETKTLVAETEKAGGKPTETQLRILAGSYYKSGDKPGYAAALEKLVSLYPKREYWADVVYRTETNPKFADRLLLDSLRFKMYAGLLAQASEYTEFAETARQAGFSIEAQKVLEASQKEGVERSKTDDAQQKKLMDALNKDAADEKKRMAKGETGSSKTALALVNNGFNYVLSGDSAKGLAMMEEGVKMTGLKYPEDAKLHLGVAYVYAGNKEKAMEAFGNVKGEDGSGELAQLWTILLRQPPKS